MYIYIRRRLQGVPNIMRPTAFDRESSQLKKKDVKQGHDARRIGWANGTTVQRVTETEPNLHRTERPTTVSI